MPKEIYLIFNKGGRGTPLKSQAILKRITKSGLAFERIPR